MHGSFRSGQTRDHWALLGGLDQLGQLVSVKGAAFVAVVLVRVLAGQMGQGVVPSPSRKR